MVNLGFEIFLKINNYEYGTTECSNFVDGGKQTHFWRIVIKWLRVFSSFPAIAIFKPLRRISSWNTLKVSSAFRLFKCNWKQKRNFHGKFCRADWVCNCGNLRTSIMDVNTLPYSNFLKNLSYLAKCCFLVCSIKTLWKLQKYFLKSIRKSTSIVVSLHNLGVDERLRWQLELVVRLLLLSPSLFLLLNFTRIASLLRHKMSVHHSHADETVVQLRIVKRLKMRLKYLSKSNHI